jgi:hypothetical protein
VVGLARQQFTFRRVPSCGDMNTTTSPRCGSPVRCRETLVSGTLRSQVLTPVIARNARLREGGHFGPHAITAPLVSVAGEGDIVALPFARGHPHAVEPGQALTT